MAKQEITSVHAIDSIAAWADDPAQASIRYIAVERLAFQLGHVSFDDIVSALDLMVRLGHFAKKWVLKDPKGRPTLEIFDSPLDIPQAMISATGDWFETDECQIIPVFVPRGTE